MLYSGEYSDFIYWLIDWLIHSFIHLLKFIIKIKQNKELNALKYIYKYKKEIYVSDWVIRPVYTEFCIIILIELPEIRYNA